MTENLVNVHNINRRRLLMFAEARNLKFRLLLGNRLFCFPLSVFHLSVAKYLKI